MNNPQKNIESQLDSLQLSSSIEKERGNEARYLALYKDLLRTRLHLPLRNDSEEDYYEESKILKRAIALERTAWASGLVVGGVVFISVRKLPFWITRLVGGKAKLQAMYDAEIAASKRPHAHFKRMGSFLFEGTFTFWAGWRAYHATINMQSNEIYHELAKIPLCQGKSYVSNALCEDFINLTKDISPDFWCNLKDDHDENPNLKHKHTFQAIYTFSENCIKRRKFESVTTKGKEEVYIPSPGVPINILELTSEEIEHLLTSYPRE